MTEIQLTAMGEVPPDLLRQDIRVQEQLLHLQTHASLDEEMV